VRRRVSPDGWALAAIVVAVLLANAPYLLGFFDPNPLPVLGSVARSVTPGLLNGTPALDPNIGYISQAISHRAALDVLHLQLPWWNPYEGTGMPLLGETQAAALFPPTLLTAFSGGEIYELLLLQLVAGISTYRLLRRIRVIRWAAVAGAIAFALTGTFAWFGDDTISHVVPFLPMLLLGIERAFAATRERRPGGWRLLAVAGALSIYAGFPEVAYVDALMMLPWLGWRCGCLERREIRTFLTKAALGTVVGVLLAGPMLIAMSGFLNHAYLGIHATADLGIPHLRGYALPQLLMPYIYGQVNGDAHGRIAEITQMVGGYVSTSLVLLALLGLFARGRRGLRLVVAAWALLVFARAYGQVPFLGHIIGILPDMSHVEFYRYGAPVLELSVIVLAALGLDDVARVPEHRRRLLWAAALVLVAVGVAGTLVTQPVLRSLAARFKPGAYLGLSIAWGAFVTLAAAAVALHRAPRVRAGLLALVLAVDALVLFAVPEFAAPSAQTADLAPVAYLKKHLGQSRFFTLGPVGPNYGSYFGLAQLNILDYPPNAYANYVHTRLDPVVYPVFFVGTFGGWRRRDQPSPTEELMRHLRSYRAAGVRYVLAPAGQRLPDRHGTFTLVFRSPTTWIYRLAGAAGYFSAPGCRVTFDGRETAHVFCPRRATLTRRETWFAGWSAQLDGRPARIQHIDGLFQGVTVPAGSHTVAFSFTPPDIKWGLLGLLGGCVLLGAPWLSSRRARWRPRGGPQAAGHPAPYLPRMREPNRHAGRIDGPDVHFGRLEL
jgi:hypothetical protein